MSSIFLTENNSTHLFKFEEFSQSVGLPFPLNQSFFAKSLLGSALSLNLFTGIKLRLRIIKYLQTVDIKKNTINYFFWFDQVTSGVLGLYIIYTLMALICQFPLSEIIGDDLCNWADLFGCIYLSSSTGWSFVIAIFRILLLKAPNQLKGNSIKNIISLLLTIFAVTNIILCSSVLAYLDKGFGYKLCTHLSQQDLEIIMTHHQPDEMQNFFILLFTGSGIMYNMIEFCCYIIFFVHVINHDNNIAAAVLQKETIRQRNHTNAITMVGLFITWIMELSYLGWIVVVYSAGFSVKTRELPTILKMFEFSLVPLVQIMTSPPLRKFTHNA